MIINSILILLLTILPGQGEAKLPDDFSTLQKISLEELAIKTNAHREVWGIGKAERWDFSQDTGELIFSFPDGLKAVAPAQVIGTFNSKDQTWLWAWANSSIDEKMSVDALKLRKHGEKHKIERLTTRKWVGTEDDAWAMAALAVKLCGRQGAYRGPAGTTYVFLSFGEVTLSRK